MHLISLSITWYRRVSRKQLRHYAANVDYRNRRYKVQWSLFTQNSLSTNPYLHPLFRNLWYFWAEDYPSKNDSGRAQKQAVIFMARFKVESSHEIFSMGAATAFNQLLCSHEYVIIPNTFFEKLQFSFVDLWILRLPSFPEFLFAENKSTKQILQTTVLTQYS